MKTGQNRRTGLARVLRVGTALGVVIITASALEAQTYDLAQPAGVTTPAGVTQASGFPEPLGVTGTPVLPSMYPGALRTETSPELVATSSRGVNEFLKESARGNQTETALTELAEGRSQNSEVIQLAQAARTCAAANNGKLQSLAQTYGVALPTSPGRKCQREIDRLQASTGAEFDKDYTKMMLTHDVKCIIGLEKASKEITAPDVAAYANLNLPKERNQVRHSENAARSVGVDQSTIDSILSELPSEDRGVAVNQ